MKRLLPAIIAFLLTIAALMPSALTLPPNGDERMDAWSSGYYGALLARLDFSSVASDLQSDPKWSPYSGWAQTQPMGGRFLHALAIGISGAPVPVYAGNDTYIASQTILAMRLETILAAAIGLALICYRFGWPAVAASVMFLLIPSVRDDLMRAWREGQLLMGFGLIAVAYGSRWLPSACGFAAALKLTALGAWPLMFLPAAVGHWPRLRLIGPLLAALITWSALNPPSWFAGGPSFLVTMILYRASEYMGQSSTVGGPLGLFLPSRYLWPVELTALMAVCVAAPRLWFRYRARVRAAVA